MSLSDTELDAKLRELLATTVRRLPADRKLTATVMQALLRAKYTDTFPEAYIASHEGFINDNLQKLVAEKEAAETSSHAAKKAAPHESEEDEDSSSDSDDEEESEDAEGSDAETSGSGSGSGSSEEEEEEDSDSSSASDGEDEEEEPEKKKARQEEEVKEQQALLRAQAAAADSDDASAVAERCKGMVACLKKLKYRVRGPEESESLTDYLNKYLVAEFTRRQMDPSRYGKHDIKRYQMEKEVQLLQQDGAVLSLDKKNRAGRGYAGVPVNGEAEQPTKSNFPSSKFLDDD